MSASRRGGHAAAWTSGGSVLAALLASACCWLPLALLLFGVSAAGIAATFDRMRPAFLVVSALLLGAGFYLNYVRQPQCDPGSACARPTSKWTHFNRSMLWVATVAVLASAVFPNYIGALVGEETAPTAVLSQEQTVLDISGMTCESCELTIDTALEKVPGVNHAIVDFAKGRAVVTLDPDSPATPDALVESVRRAGYDASLNGEPRK